MRRKAGIAVAACAALALTGTTGATAWKAAGDNRPVGTWQQAPSPVERTPVAAEQTEQAEQAERADRAAGAEAAGAEAAPMAGMPDAAVTGETNATAAPNATPGMIDQEGRHESASTVKGDGRQKVGELLSVRKLLGYLGGKPKKE